MPSEFGFETPQEVLARLRLEDQERRLAFGKTALGQSPGGQVGQSLGSIFGPALRRASETRAFRKSEAQRFVEATGVSQREARQLAKQNIPAEFAQVRQAKDVQKAGQSSVKLRDELIRNGTSVVDAQVAGMFSMASTLRNLGLNDQATELSLQATQIDNAEQLRLAKIEDMKADLNATRANTLNTLDHIANRGETAFTKLVNKQSSLIAQIDTSDDPQEIADLEREKGNIEGQIAKQNFVSLSDADERQLLSRAGTNKVAGEIFELEVVDNKLASLEQTLLDNKGSFASTKWGEIAAASASFMEQWFGIDPASIGADTLIGDVTAIKGGAAFLSAELRHELTGAAMSPAEAVFLEPFLAGPADSLSKKLAKVRVVRKYTSLDIAKRTELLNDALAGSKWLVEAEKVALEEIALEKLGRTSATSLDERVTGAVSRVDELIREAEGN